MSKKRRNDLHNREKQLAAQQQRERQLLQDTYPDLYSHLSSLFTIVQRFDTYWLTRPQPENPTNLILVRQGKGDFGAYMAQIARESLIFSILREHHRRNTEAE